MMPLMEINVIPPSPPEPRYVLKVSAHEMRRIAHCLRAEEPGGLLYRQLPDEVVAWAGSLPSHSRREFLIREWKQGVK